MLEDTMLLLCLWVHKLQQVNHFTKGSLELFEAKKIPAQNKQAYKHLLKPQWSQKEAMHIMACLSANDTIM